MSEMCQEFIITSAIYSFNKFTSALNYHPWSILIDGCSELLRVSSVTQILLSKIKDYSFCQFYGICSRFDCSGRAKHWVQLRIVMS